MSSKSTMCFAWYSSDRRKNWEEEEEERRSRDSYSNCVYEMLRQVHSDTGISFKSCNLINSFATYNCRQSADEVSCSLTKGGLELVYYQLQGDPGCLTRLIVGTGQEQQDQRILKRNTLDLKLFLSLTAWIHSYITGSRQSVVANGNPRIELTPGAVVFQYPPIPWDPPQPPPLVLGEEVVPVVETTVYLGYHIDPKLTGGVPIKKAIQLQASALSHHSSIYGFPAKYLVQASSGCVLNPVHCFWHRLLFGNIEVVMHSSTAPR